MPVDAQCRLLRRVGVHVGQDHRVGNRFDQPRAERGSRDSKNDVRVAFLAGDWIARGLEVGLGEVAARRAASTGTDTKVMHSAVFHPSIALRELLVWTLTRRRNNP